MKVRNHALHKAILDKAVKEALGKAIAFSPIQLANSVNLHTDKMFKEGIERFNQRTDLIEEIKSRKELNDLIGNFLRAKDKQND